MHSGPVILELPETERPARDLCLLIAPEPWSLNFAQNLGELFRRNEPTSVDTDLAAFWPDVFVEPSLPWARFVQSATYHMLVLALIWAGSRFLALQPHVTVQPTITSADVIYYTPSEYLPPIDTRGPTRVKAQRADPELSAQPIISVPPEADNRSQTIVAPPHIQLQLHHDVPMPNIVAWEGTPQIPIGPAPVVLASEIARLAPRVERSVIAPPADVQENVQENLQKNVRALQGPQPAVIAPPPALQADSRRMGNLDIANSSVIAPAPQLSLDAQRTAGSRRSTALRARSTQVVAPPPSLGASGGSRSGANMIALNLHPAVGAPAQPAAGNRRGTFAATPEGHRGASGAAGAPKAEASGKKDGTGSHSKSGDSAPSGLYVGKGPDSVTTPIAGNSSSTDSKTYSVNPALIANAHPPRASTRNLKPDSENNLSETERAVFGNRKFYSLSLNMPNLNSAGGSWIIRFAALKGEKGESSAVSYSREAAARASSGGAPVSSSPVNDLSAPAATRKVDPAYPLELMRQNVGGTVILYGVIHADGTVGNIRVLRSVDERLDRFASEAIAKWQFQPATNNGAPVDVEATFSIPFHPGKTGSNF
jgi:TonB family protein